MASSFASVAIINNMIARALPGDVAVSSGLL